MDIWIDWIAPSTLNQSSNPFLALCPKVTTVRRSNGLFHSAADCSPLSLVYLFSFSSLLSFIIVRNLVCTHIISFYLSLLLGYISFKLRIYTNLLKSYFGPIELARKCSVAGKTLHLINAVLLKLFEDVPFYTFTFCP